MAFTSVESHWEQSVLKYQPGHINEEFVGATPQGWHYFVLRGFPNSKIGLENDNNYQTNL